MHGTSLDRGEHRLFRTINTFTKVGIRLFFLVKPLGKRPTFRPEEFSQ